jgi:hypothetical protein
VGRVHKNRTVLAPCQMLVEARRSWSVRARQIIFHGKRHLKSDSFSTPLFSVSYHDKYIIVFKLQGTSPSTKATPKPRKHSQNPTGNCGGALRHLAVNGRRAAKLPASPDPLTAPLLEEEQKAAKNEIVHSPSDLTVP